jgi:hypothetical protein
MAVTWTAVVVVVVVAVLPVVVSSIVVAEIASVFPFRLAPAAFGRQTASTLSPSLHSQ